MLILSLLTANPLWNVRQLHTLPFTYSQYVYILIAKNRWICINYFWTKFFFFWIFSSRLCYFWIALNVCCAWTRNSKLRWPINYVYFWFSLLFLIGRTAFVFLTAAAINDEAKEALGVLRRVSDKTWCVEVSGGSICGLTISWNGNSILHIHIHMHVHI